MKKQQTQAQAHYCFKQEAGSNIVKLYIYDDVSEYGEFDWWTWEYKESETSAKYFKKALAMLLVNEARSILENLVECGYNIPDFLIKGLAVTQKMLNNKAEIPDANDEEK